MASQSEAVRKKIIRERVQLLLRYPFFGHLALGLELRELSQAELAALPPEKRTMATDGIHLFYNPSFVDGLSDRHLRSGLGHEVLHCILGHLWRRGAREKSKWNIAVDHATNLILQKEGFEIPPQWYCDNQFEGMEAERIYAKLPDSPSGHGALFDSHDLWPGEIAGKSSAPGVGEDDPNQTVTSGGILKPGSVQELEKVWKERLIRAAASARLRGTIPGIASMLVQDLLEPKISWQNFLRDFVVSTAVNDFRLLPPAKKFLWRGIYLPTTRGETLEIAIGVDTSGSVLLREFQENLAEIRSITEQFESFVLHLFFCDAAIHDRITLTSEDEWPDSFPKADGGTNFVPVFEAIAEEELPISALVYLTDGHGTYPETPPEYPVLWVLNSNYTVPWGQSIRLEQEL